jgi:hypothetical protein
MSVGTHLAKWDAVPAGPFFGSREEPAGLPTDYVEAARTFGGREGFLGQQYLRLYRLSELAELNALYEFSTYNPALLVFASDGYGEVFAFDRLSWKVLKVPVIPFPVPGEEVDVVAENFTSFVRTCSAEHQTHRADPKALGKELHLKKPLCLGGDWNDQSNLVLVTPIQHAELARYWNKLYRDLLSRQREAQ